MPVLRGDRSIRFNIYQSLAPNLDFDALLSLRRPVDGPVVVLVLGTRVVSMLVKARVSSSLSSANRALFLWKRQGFFRMQKVSCRCVMTVFDVDVYPALGDGSNVRLSVEALREQCRD